MRPDIKAAWVRALRSDRFRQGRSRLRSEYDEYCCLGVLCEVARDFGLDVTASLEEGGYVYSYKETSGSELAPQAIAEWAGLDDTHGTYNGIYTLAADNDSGYTFEEIADTIEENL